MHLSKDKSKGVITYVKPYGEVNVLPKRLKLRGLEKEIYKVVETNEVYGGDELMYVGLYRRIIGRLSK